MHTYPPRRKHLLAQQLIYCHDVFIDVPTSLSIDARQRNLAAQCLLPEVIKQLNTQGYRSARYTLMRHSGRIRHSTADVVDARNALALRYGAMTVLLEGRQSLRSDTPRERARMQAAMIASLRLVLRWAQDHCALLTEASPSYGDGAPVVTRARYVRADRPVRMLFKEALSDEIRQITLPGRFTPHLRSCFKIYVPIKTMT